MRFRIYVIAERGGAVSKIDFMNGTASQFLIGGSRAWRLAEVPRRRRGATGCADSNGGAPWRDYAHICCKRGARSVCANGAARGDRVVSGHVAAREAICGRRGSTFDKRRFFFRVREAHVFIYSRLLRRLPRVEKVAA